ncbi:hypothetical protein GW930_01390 [Candidatus Saccharibacteria bacterium]|nr:hypothetical protein [Candidatus Saccharibacteria bacterium]
MSERIGESSEAQAMENERQVAVRQFGEEYGIDAGLIHAARKTDLSEPEDPLWNARYRLITPHRRVIILDTADTGMLSASEARLNATEGPEKMEIPSINVFLRNINALDEAAREMLGGKGVDPSVALTYKHEADEKRAVLLYQRTGGGGLRNTLAPVIHDVSVMDLLAGDMSQQPPIGIEVPLRNSLSSRSPDLSPVTLAYANGEKTLLFSAQDLMNSIGSDTNYTLEIINEYTGEVSRSTKFLSGFFGNVPWQSAYPVMCRGGYEWV